MSIWALWNLVWFIYRMLSSKQSFVKTEAIAVVFYFGHKWVSTYNFHISWVVWAKFDIEYLCAIVLTYCEFHKIHYSEKHILLTGINCPFFLHFFIILGSDLVQELSTKMYEVIMSFVKTGAVLTSPVVVSELLSLGCLPVYSYSTTKWIQWSSYNSKYF
jgi:hypothetical protein